MIDLIIYLLLSITFTAGMVVVIKNMYRDRTSRQFETDLLGKSLKPKPIKVRVQKRAKKQEEEKKNKIRDFDAPDLSKTLIKEPKDKKTDLENAAKDKTLEELRKF